MYDDDMTEMMENTLDDELRPCPFCGGEAHFASYHDMNGEVVIYARCDNCRSSTVHIIVSDSSGDNPFEDMLKTAYEIRDLWNRRDD